jgi:hypothetical protein
MLISTALLFDSKIRNSIHMYSGKIAVPPGSRREILLLGSVRESIMTPSKTSSEKNNLCVHITRI